MRRTFRATRASSALGCAFLLAACAPQERYVGAEPLPAQGADSGANGADSGLGTPTYFTDFDTGSGWKSTNHITGSSTSFGVVIAGADDPSTAEIRFPGHPEYASTDDDMPDSLTEVYTAQRFGFGTFRSRVRFGSCASTEEAVSSALGYFNDMMDENGNGITDDVEIAWQVPCGTPGNLSLTVFTDNQDSPAAFRKLSHVIDFTTGNYYDTPSASQEGFVKSGNDPAFLRPELFDSNQFYELGYEWHTDSLRFFLMLDGADVTVWTLTDASHVPQLPVTFVFNARHTASHWYPASGGADYPANDVVTHIDWFEYFAE